MKSDKYIFVHEEFKINGREDYYYELNSSSSPQVWVFFFLCLLLLCCLVLILCALIVGRETEDLPVVVLDFFVIEVSLSLQEQRFSLLLVVLDMRVLFIG